jgi:hypothetical protein
MQSQSALESGAQEERADARAFAGARKCFQTMIYQAIGFGNRVSQSPDRDRIEGMTFA